MGGQPLAGRSIVVTRPAGQADGLCAALEALGAEPLCFPLLTIAPVAQSPVFPAQTRNIQSAKIAERGANHQMAIAQFELLETIEQQSTQRLPIPGGPLITRCTIQQPLGHDQIDPLELQRTDHPLPLTQTLPQIQLQRDILYP